MLIRYAVSLVLPLALAGLLLWAGNATSAATALLGGVIGTAIGEASSAYCRRLIGYHPAP
jgi:hypothetical protein